VVKKKITIVPKDRSLLNVVTDPAASPFNTGSIVIEHALARATSKGGELVIKFNTKGALTPLVSYHVWLQAGDQKIDYGTLVAGTQPPNHSYGSYTATKTVKELSPDVKTLDILFEVDEKPAERFTAIERIWGKPHQIKGVKLERFDLGNGGTDRGAAGAQGKSPITQPS
jgi:hypothetical protein